MQVTQLGAIAGLVFAGWMFYMSYTVIGVLCPWCLTLDVAMVVLFFGVTRYNILGDFFPVSKQTNDKLQKFVKNSYDMLAMWSVLVLGVLAIILKFGSDLFA
jgi:hypothetical protein